MARIAAFTPDAFPSSIGAGWTNGPGDFDPMTWVSAGVIAPSAAGADCAIVRSGGVYCSDQFSTVVVESHSSNGSTSSWLGGMVRAAGGANEEGYLSGVVASNGVARYQLLRVDNSFGFTTLASTGADSTTGLPPGTRITTQAVGTSIQLYTDEGGSDTLRLSVTDATLAEGLPGVSVYVGAGSTGRISAVEGGHYFHEQGAFLVGVGPYTSGTGNVTPQIPTVESNAADYFPLLLAHSAGGQSIALGTANGFTELADSPSATGAGTAGVRVAAFGNSSGAGGSNPIITDPGDHCGALIALVWHPDGLPVVDATSANQKGTASTSFSISGVTTTAADALVMPISGRNTDSAAAAYSGWTNANLTGLAEIFDGGTTDGNGGGLGIAAGIKASAGATGATTGTVTSSINANYCIAFIPASGGTPIEIDAGVDALTITENQALVRLSRHIAAGLDSLAINELPAAVQVVTNTDIDAGFDALAISEQPASVSTSKHVEAGADALTISEQPATVGLGRNIPAGTAAITLSTHPATVNRAQVIPAGFDQLAIAGQGAQVFLSRNVAAGVDALVITESPAQVRVLKDISAGLDALVLTGHAATVGVGSTIAAGVAAMVISEQAATLALAKHIAAEVAALTLTPRPATVTVGMHIGAAVAELAIAELPATIALAKHVAAGMDSLTLTEQQAVVRILQDIPAGFDALVIAEQPAAVQVARGIMAGFDTLTLQELAAQVRLAKSVEAEVAALLINEQPAVIELANQVLAGVDQLVLTEHQATVEGVQAIILALARRFIARAPEGTFRATAPKGRFNA